MTVFVMISLMHCYFNYTNWAFMDSAAEKKLKSILNSLLCFHKQLSLLFLLYLFVCFGTKHPISSWVKVNCTASHLNKLYHCRLAYAIEVIQSFSCLRAYLFPCWPANCSICKGKYFVFFSLYLRENLHEALFGVVLKKTQLANRSAFPNYSSLQS